MKEMLGYQVDEVAAASSFFFNCSSKYNNYNSYHITYLDMHIYTYIKKII